MAGTIMESNAPVLAETIYRDGIVSLPGVLSAAWADQLDGDLKREFMAALSCEGGTAPRGWNRFYFEPYAERITGFLELIQYPVLVHLSTELFGADYMVVELGADIPLPGAVDQPWHRDFPMPPETREGRISSVCINASSVDVTPHMGPFQIVPGTQFESGDEFDGGMFPSEARYPEYDARKESRFGTRGSVSVRSGLCLHRGSRSSNRSRLRPVAIVGVVSQECGAVTERRVHPDDPHVPRLRVSRAYIESVPPAVREHLSYEVVSDTEQTLPPHFTHHTFEGLKMAEMA